MIFNYFKNMISTLLFLLVAACDSSDAPAKIAEPAKIEAVAPAVDSPKIEISKPAETAAQPTERQPKIFQKQIENQAVPQKKAAARPAEKPLEKPAAAPVQPSKIEIEKLATPTAETIRIHQPEIIAPPQPAPTIHEIWDELLKKYVSPTGKVNYRGFKNEQAKLDAYLQKLSENVPTAANSRNEKMAFWINAYNAATIRLILENYPISSITKLDGGKTWDVRRIQLGSKKYSLNEIENEILRPQFRDPRIHFAVNCAAKSCPPLLNEAFFSEKLDSQLEQQTRRFVQSRTANSISENAVEVSKIFEWYTSDFGDLKKFLNRYSTVKISDAALVKFKEYDWGLNE